MTPSDLEITRAVYDQRQAMLDERFHTQQEAVRATVESQRRAVDKALEATERAIDRRQTAADKEFHEHLEQVRHETDLAFVNSEKAVRAALEAQKEAVAKAETANEKRFESVNEFRGQLNDQATRFVTRVESGANFQRYDDRINDLQTRLDKAEGNRAGSFQVLASMMTVMTVVIGLVVFFANYLTN